MKIHLLIRVNRIMLYRKKNETNDGAEARWFIYISVK